MFHMPRFASPRPINMPDHRALLSISVMWHSCVLVALSGHEKPAQRSWTGCTQAICGPVVSAFPNRLLALYIARKQTPQLRHIGNRCEQHQRQQQRQAELEAHLLETIA
jgi:hypothetical protein